MRVETSALIKIDSPVTLANGCEYDIAYEVSVDYRADVNGDFDCDRVEFSRDGKTDDVTVMSVAMTVSGLGLKLDCLDEDKLFDLYLAVPKNRKRLEQRLCDEWSRRGYQRWRDDCEIEQSEMRRAV